MIHAEAGESFFRGQTVTLLAQSHMLHVTCWSGIADLTRLEPKNIADLRPILEGFSGPTYGGASGGLLRVQTRHPDYCSISVIHR
jgi:hypothetical protein